MSNLAARFAVAIVAVPALLALLVWGPVWGWWLLAGVVGAVGLDEYGGITLGPERDVHRVVLVLLGLLITAGLVLALDPGLAARCSATGCPCGTGLILALLLASVFVPLLFHLFASADPRQAVDRASRTTLGALYVGGLFGILCLVRTVGGDDGWRWILVLLGLNWCNDTGGYFAGRFLGKRKLFERVSPKKTWAGAVGGVAAGTAWLFITRVIYLPELTVVDCLVLGLVGGPLGQVGDLVESVLKRAFAIKDSGAVLPGHGGILDRMDAVLFTAPLVYFYARWVHPL